MLKLADFKLNNIAVRLSSAWKLQSASPLRTAILVMFCYAALVTPSFVYNHMDFSLFIVAGDKFVSPDKSAGPIIIEKNSFGYDGQFFYRFALAPFRFEDPAFGIHIDNPEKRMSRIVYPLISWVVALGQSAYVPLAMFAVNIAGLGIIGALLSAFARKFVWLEVAIAPILIWPGLFVALRRDTAEIVTIVFILSALLNYMSQRRLLYAVFASCAILTRESAAPVFAGLLLWEACATWRDNSHWPALIYSTLLFVPFALWRFVSFLIWHSSSSKYGFEHDVGWPFVGVFRMIYLNISGERHWSDYKILDVLFQFSVVVSAILLIAFFSFVFIRGVATSIKDGGPSALFASWLPTAGLMSVLTASGPWIEPFAYYRALTECYVVGCLAMASGGFRFDTKLYRIALLAGLADSYLWFAL